MGILPQIDRNMQFTSREKRDEFPAASFAVPATARLYHTV
jgi:hypothetical protein